MSEVCKCGHSKKFHNLKSYFNMTDKRCSWFYMTTNGDNGCSCEKFEPKGENKTIKDLHETRLELIKKAKQKGISYEEYVTKRDFEDEGSEDE